MQKDMHYYGTYTLARAAGLKKEIAYVIATAAQFVDDNAKNEDIILQDGSRIHTIATAHHPIDKSNSELDDQRYVWVPFHFLPGNEGNNYYEKLICKMDGSTIKRVLDFTYLKKDSNYFIELVGIVAHVYADTFAHYGFSGVSNDYNDVSNDTIEMTLDEDIFSYIKSKKDKFLARFGGILSLGHGGVFTYPDRPYLKWSFKYKHGEVNHRNNQQIFLDGSEALFSFFKKIGEIRPDLVESSIDLSFGEIKEKVNTIISQQRDKNGRCELWREYVRSGMLSSEITEEIPEYVGWNDDIDLLQKMSSNDVITQNIFKFFQAASVYRTYILRDLLPQKGLIVG